MSIKAACMGALAALVLVGCTSVTRLTDCRGVKVEEGLTPIETVEIFNSNWLLLSLIPIASGDPDNPDGWTTCFFRNTVNLDSQMKMLEAEAKRVGASKAVNVTSITTDETVILLAFLREKYHTTAVLVK